LGYLPAYDTLTLVYKSYDKNRFHKLFQANLALIFASFRVVDAEKFFTESFLIMPFNYSLKIRWRCFYVAIWHIYCIITQKKVKGESMKRKIATILILITGLFWLNLNCNTLMAGEIKTVVLNVPNLPSGS